MARTWWAARPARPPPDSPRWRPRPSSRLQDQRGYRPLLRDPRPRRPPFGRPPGLPADFSYTWWAVRLRRPLLQDQSMLPLPKEPAHRFVPAPPHCRAGFQAARSRRLGGHPCDCPSPRPGDRSDPGPWLCPGRDGRMRRYLCPPGNGPPRRTWTRPETARRKPAQKSACPRPSPLKRSGPCRRRSDPGASWD